MENISNQIEESIQKSSIPIISSEQLPSTSSSTSSGTSGYTLLGIHWSIWLIILVLLFGLFALGLSLFVSKMKDIRTQYSSFFDMLDMFGKIGSQQNKKQNSENQKGIEMVGSNSSSLNNPTPINNNDSMNQNMFGNLLNKPITSNKSTKNTYNEDSNTSSIQKKGGKGFCYIGEDKGTRVCASVEESDTCMSGNIFPTKDMCINPSLR
jgi:hypothetical protein